MIKKILRRIVVFILQLEARLVLYKYKPKIIAITGSVGKTGTKDAVFSVISEKHFSFKSEKSYNSELGIPLTILQAKTGWDSVFVWLRNILKGASLIIMKNHYPGWLVLEAGVDRPGDMERTTRWIKPDIAIITKFSDIPPHVEFFSSNKELYDEKWKLVTALKKDGFVVLNADDENVMEYRDKAEGRQVITYGFSDSADIKGSNCHPTYKKRRGVRVPDGMTFKVDCNGKSVPIKISHTLGNGYVYSMLAGIAVGVKENINLIDIMNALESFEPPPGRLKLLEGIENSVVIDDTYNSSPEALKLALSIFENIEVEGRKIVVLGDMLELGKHTIEAHSEIGEVLPETDLLFLVGPRARYIEDGVGKRMKKSQILKFNDSVEAGEKLKKTVKEGDIILVKGSQGIRMERVVDLVMAHPDKKKKLLVRQEPEWQNR